VVAECGPPLYMKKGGCAKPPFLHLLATVTRSISL